MRNNERKVWYLYASFQLGLGRKTELFPLKSSKNQFWPFPYMLKVHGWAA